jgi:LPS sulfotransferase NodH
VIEEPNPATPLPHGPGPDGCVDGRLTHDDYQRILSEVGVRRVCVSLIPGRCGSTLLGQLVAQWGCCGTGTEAFHERQEAQWRRFVTSDGFYFASVVRREALGGIFWFQSTPLRHDYLLTMVAPTIPSTWRYSAILRRDVVAQAMSYVFAIGSGVWHSSSRRYDPSTPIGLKEDLDLLAERVVHWIVELVAIEERIRQILDARIDGPPLVLFYEDIVRDPQEAMLRFCRDAGSMPPVDAPPARQTLSRLKKRGDEQLRERLMARHGDSVSRLLDARAESTLAWAEELGRLAERRDSAAGSPASPHAGSPTTTVVAAPEAQK